ncbi:uncharacterized protein TRIADDRAFT_60715 [Trichoplax adhaerens]|uniref:Uncharacterized protein n=1 Tax=Trichoplax adhaerens TaxID=10228 RepID=B3S966_TRIAD|nr:hypothetical protein TRIADDRAFT_60715 [Trichoplax adhaerens]EDV20750.1 hypothetical protein TRIADDRAFT_60715 [Trichoplax adhaerens]|eukprot:XP_002116691.1 hypothetical protein TRIADDRAFT_60715 [Trichoplax adhaerens]
MSAAANQLQDSTKDCQSVDEEFTSKVESYKEEAEKAKNEGKFNEEIACYEKILTMIDEATVNDPTLPDLKCETYLLMAARYRNRRQFAAALEYCDKTEQIAERTSIKIRISEAYDCRGSILCEEGSLDAAVDAFHKAEKLKKEFMSEDDPRVAQTYDGLGWTYRQQGKLQLAIDTYKKALKIRLEAGSNGMLIAVMYTLLSDIYAKQENYEEAVTAALESLKIKKSLFGDDFPNKQDELRDIAALYFKLGKAKEAMEILSS